jgi:O-antigen/teichoic acid export membrane protein
LVHFWPSGDRFRRLFVSKLGRDLGVSYVALIVLACSGLTINVVIAAVHGAEVLGAFNQAYAVLMIVAQIATFGIDAAATRMAAQDGSGQGGVGETARATMAAAAVVVLPLSGLMLAVLAFWPRHLLIDLLIPIAFGMPAIAFNRVLAGLLNGERRMGLYSGVQSARYLLLVAGIVGLCVGGGRPEHLGWAFVAAEVPPLLYLIFGPYRRSLFESGTGLRTRLGVIWRFGAASLPGNTIVEINGRIDVILLSLLADAREVGIYSLAAALFEGLTQLFVVIQTNLNPIVAKSALAHDAEGLRALVADTARIVYPVFALALVGALALHPLVVRGAIGREEFMASWPMLAASGACLMVVAGYLPFKQLTLFLGRPGIYSLQIAAMATTTVAAGLLLIPEYQGLGAALAAGLGQVACVAATAVAAARVFGAPLPLPWTVVASSAFRRSS